MFYGGTSMEDNENTGIISILEALEHCEMQMCIFVVFNKI